MKGVFYLKTCSTIVFALSFLLFSFNILLAVSKPFTEIQPPPAEKKDIQEQIAIFEKNLEIKSDEETAYEIALLYIRYGDLKKAELFLKKAIETNPHFFEAFLQLAYLNLWQKDLQSSYENFQIVLKESHCDALTFSGLETIAHEWAKEAKTEKKALEIFSFLNECIKNNPDYLFYEARILSREKQSWDQAEKLLLQAIEIAPKYSDVDFLLANLYFKQKKWEKAEAIYKKYPNDLEANEGLARIALIKENFKEAEILFSDIVAKNPNNLDALSTLGNVHFENQHFTQAKKEYKKLLLHLENDDSVYKRLFETKIHTDPSVLIKSFFIATKENDPQLHAPVVNDYYQDNSIHFRFPIIDTWLTEIAGFYGFQKERNIYRVHKINYNVGYGGARVLSHYFLHRYMKWDFFVDVIRSWNIGTAVFPYKNSTKFHPGTAYIYNDEKHHLFVAEGHFEPLIIKDFDKRISRMLTLKPISLLYRFYSNQFCCPEAEAFFYRIFYNDNLNNRQDGQLLTFRFSLPFLKSLTFFYEWEHRTFKHLSPNYFSVKRQWRDVIGIHFYQEFLKNGYIDFVYRHRWQFSHDLLQPIGSFLFVAKRQKLIANNCICLIGRRFKEYWKFEVGGEYFKDTLPYRDWSIFANLLIEF